MSHTVSDAAQQPRIVVYRYGSMDVVSINFILPRGILKETRGAEIAKEVQAYIANKGLDYGHVANHHPHGWHQTADGWRPNVDGGPYAQ